MTPCEHTPCEPQKNFERSVKWVIGILIIAGGAGLGLSLRQSSEARSEAAVAIEASKDTLLLRNENKYIREDIAEIKVALGAVNRIELKLSDMAGDFKAMNVRMDGWDGKQNDK